MWPMDCEYRRPVCRACTAVVSDRGFAPDRSSTSARWSPEATVAPTGTRHSTSPARGARDQAASFARCRVALRGGQGRGLARDQAAVAQEGHDGGGILRGQFGRHVGLSAQFEDRGETGGGQLVGRQAKGAAQPDPYPCVAFVEQPAGDFLLKQDRPRAHETPQFRGLFCMFRVGIKVQQGTGVAMHVHHHVGVDGQRQQRLLVGLFLGQVGQVGHRRDQGCAGGCDVVRRVVVQPAAQPVDHPGGQVGPVAVEIAAAIGKGEPPEALHVQSLRQADGVGGGHDDDLALDLARLLRGIQQRDQLAGGQGGGQFVGMQSAVDIDLGPGARRSPAVRGQETDGAGAGFGQGDLKRLVHGALIRSGRGAVFIAQSGAR